MALNGQKVTLNGKYITNPDKSKYFDVESIGTKRGPSAATASPISVVGDAVQVKGKTVFKDEEFSSLGIKKTYSLAGKSVGLVQLNSGGTACPAEYVFVTVGSDGAASVTNKFGNCSDMPKISKQGEKITLAFPGNPAETWIYVNGKIAKKK